MATAQRHICAAECAACYGIVLRRQAGCNIVGEEEAYLVVGGNGLLPYQGGGIAVIGDARKILRGEAGEFPGKRCGIGLQAGERGLAEVYQGIVAR